MAGGRRKQGPARVPGREAAGPVGGTKQARGRGAVVQRGTGSGRGRGPGRQPLCGLPSGGQAPGGLTGGEAGRGGQRRGAPCAVTRAREDPVLAVRVGGFLTRFSQLSRLREAIGGSKGSGISQRSLLGCPRPLGPDSFRGWSFCPGTDGVVSAGCAVKVVGTSGIAFVRFSKSNCGMSREIYISGR